MPPYDRYSGPGRESSSVYPRAGQTAGARHERESTILPPIRQAIPELQLDVQRDGLARTPPLAISPTGGQFSEANTPPEYVVSPSQYKRRRLSYEEERRSDWASQVPRPYATPRQVGSRPQSPAPRGWGDSDRSSSYINNVAFPSIISPVSANIPERAEPRPTLPSLPLLNFERGVGETLRMQGQTGDEYTPEEPRRLSLVTSTSHGPSNGGHGYQPVSFTYNYHHPTRAQSLSVGSAHMDRTTPFSPGAYTPRYQENFMRVGDFGLGTSRDGKQRKRRGNLPKETTDKLRGWFVNHLHHPYPTEDEKQELMRQTGLQMNQISNWFINARRRQLPTMISNARAEADAMNSRAVDGKAIPSSERIDYEQDSKLHSDSEGSNYESIETGSAKRHRPNDLKRESI
ncbi:putative homeobox domain-containing protein [Rosellinia necatrix]|uniref:Putative homeobox domain-containing protein n=1 Tax=Rosellinia necatrix TaxID=77044 RepID=A0A1W2TMT4_ROSNE|nr:putative homeobox domain-containing protein [Rosellinia necatrix]